MANTLKSFFGAVWRVLDGLRKVLHLFILLIFLALILAVFSGELPRIPSSAALVLAPEGDIVEQLEGNPVDRAWARVTGGEKPQTLLRDILDALTLAKDDERIKAVVLDLDGMQGAGLSKLQAIAAALQTIKESGKKVIAVGDFYTQNQYFLAAHADEVYMHPYGLVFLQGYGRYRTFFKDALDKLYVDVNVFKTGEYKSYAEPYSRNDMSEADREASLEWLNELWAVYREAVAQARGLDSNVIDDYSNGFLEALQHADGDLARVALETGLVDALWTRDQMRERLKEEVGVDQSSHTFKNVHFTTYLQGMRAQPAAAGTKRNNVGIIVASGDILDGEHPPGTIGGDTLAGLIRQARHDDGVKAVVLRVDSGGGSLLASEIIAAELDLLEQAGKPLVVSMGSVAASGGYWISTPGEEIWASPTTLTGSIGVIGLFPTFQRSLDKLGVHVDGVGTTELSGDFRPDRALGEDAREIMQLSVDKGYREFLAGVAESRGKTVEEIDAIARGRVWTGTQAHELGLVDHLGGQEDAVTAAAKLAAVDGDYGVKYIEKSLTFGEQLALEFLSVTSRLLAKAGWTPGEPSGLRQLLSSVEQQLTQLAIFNDPRGLYSLCFCNVR